MNPPAPCPDFNAQPALDELRPARLVEWDDSTFPTLREAFESANEDTDPVSCFPIGESIETAPAMMFVVKGAAQVQMVRKILIALAFVTPGKEIVEPRAAEVTAAGFEESQVETPGEVGGA